MTSTLVVATYALVKTWSVHAMPPQLSGDATSFIAQPAEWVPFSANVEITHVGSSPTVYGRFFRDSHGCGRLETGPKGETAVIYVKNIPREEYSFWTGRSGRWVTGPMKLPAFGWKPVPRRTNVPGLVKRPLFAEVRRGRIYSLRAKSGFSAYTYVNLSGTFSLQVPELNFFEIVKQTLEGRREVYSELEVADQPEELFLPPRGVPVIPLSDLGGIIAEPGHDGIADHIEKMISGQRH